MKKEPQGTPEGAGEARVAKNTLYRAGWKWSGRTWNLLETRRPAKLLHVELANWREAIAWERRMAAGLTLRSEQSPSPENGDG